jgi:hypothetical protein
MEQSDYPCLSLTAVKNKAVRPNARYVCHPMPAQSSAALLLLLGWEVAAGFELRVSCFESPLKLRRTRNVSASFSFSRTSQHV